MSVNLQAEYKYYLDHKAEFLAKYEGKFIVLKHQKVLGVYSSDLEAIKETTKKEELGTFIVQHVTNNENQVRFHSRVAV